MANLKPLRELRNIIAGILVGCSWPSWFMLFYFDDKWKMTGPVTPGGGYIYAHVEHGGLTYYSAMQSAASHLVFPIFFLGIAGIILAPKKNMQTKKSHLSWRMAWDQDDPYHLCYIAMGISAVLAITAVYFYGHDIIKFFMNMGLQPYSDTRYLQ